MTENLSQAYPRRPPFKTGPRPITPGSAGLLTLALLWGGCTAPVAHHGSPSLGTSSGVAVQATFNTLGLDPADPLPGYAGAVGIGNELVYSSAGGWADVAAQRLATPNTRFRIYSTSKCIGAVLAMRLAELGQLNLDAPIATYLPSLPNHLRVITVRHLLAHRSGIRHYRPGEWDRVSSRICTGPQEALADFIHDPLLFEPGSGYQYTTFGYVLLSAVLESAAGQPFEALVQERVFKPSGMVATALEGRSLPGEDLAVFYDRTETGTFSPTTGIHASCKFFGGGLVSTAEDLVRFGLALVNGRLVSQASLREILTVHSEGGGTHPPYGYGFFPGKGTFTTTFGIPLEDEVPAWWHGGNGRGGYSVLIIYPERRAAAAITTNVRATGRVVRATHSMALPFLRPPGLPSQVHRSGSLSPSQKWNTP